ncbi:type II methionyl aminopeptidase [Candidatus Micrarchaeota archaeon CG1_02_55_22]|nr:MAG: type II methionyl aminopeptidase [Candidatus Micrarchaeota archaeon CG1_02_55_22]
MARKALLYAQGEAKPGVKLLDLAEKIELFITDNGGKPAFPVNLGIGNVAAHYTPSAEETAVLGEKDVLKVDLGVHIEGLIVDCAQTIDLSGENGKLVEASKKALENALSVMRVGANSRDVGAEIQKTIESYGFKPIENLCGHSLQHWELHAGREIPNVAMGNSLLEEGEIYAVEPFASTGSGRVREATDSAEIYSLMGAKNVRMQASRRVLELVAEEYRTLPFAKRWLQEVPMLQFALSDLEKQGLIHGYGVLHDDAKSLVSQAETTVIIEKDGVKVLV